MKNGILALFCLISSLLSPSLYAQEDTESGKSLKFHYRIVAGLNIGGLTPVPLPDNIRKIKTFDPTLSPYIGVEGVYTLNNKWSVGISPQLQYKGMKVKNEVMYLHTIIQMGEGAEASSFEGAFTGTNYTEVKNLYLGVPFFVQFTPKDKWHYRLGGYFGFLLNAKFQGTVSDGYIRNGGSLGEKVQVTSASFDFAKHVRTFDFGLHAGAVRDLGKKFTVDAGLQWGLRSAFPSSFSGISFPMYNIYAQLGVGYRL